MLGVILALSSLFADQLALGTPGSGFGMKQLAGTVAGILVAAGGALVLQRFPPIDDEPDDEESGDQQT